MKLSIDLMLTEPVSAVLTTLLLKLTAAPSTREFCDELERIQFDEYELDDVSRIIVSITV